MGKKSFRFAVARFHVEYGPESLFDRVRFILESVTGLDVHIPHYRQRLHERNIPEKVTEAIQKFDVHLWRIVSAEVRTDTGKFVSATLEREFDGRIFVITIGLRNSVVTIYEKNSSGIEKCLKEGELYDFVERVNSQLMEGESSRSAGR